MDINEAQFVIQAAADELTEALRAKGYQQASAQIWIGYGEGALVHLDSHPLFVPSGPDLWKVVNRAREAIAALPDPHAMDAWFDPTYSTCGPIAQAAE